MSNPDKNFNYYDNFEPGGKGMTFEFLFKTLAENKGRFQALFDRLADEQALKISILGSATPRNLDYMANFLHAYRKPSPEDKINIVDKTAFTLEQHSASGHMLKLPQLELVQGDMNSIPLRKNSSDLVIADFTLNLNSSFPEVEVSINNIERVLKNQGLFLGSIVTGLEKGKVTSPHSVSYLELPFGETFFSMAELRGLSKKHSLYTQGEVTSRPNKNSNIEVTDFLMQKISSAKDQESYLE